MDIKKDQIKNIGQAIKKHSNHFVLAFTRKTTNLEMTNVVAGNPVHMVTAFSHLMAQKPEFYVMIKAAMDLHEATLPKKSKILTLNDK